MNNPWRWEQYCSTLIISKSIFLSHLVWPSVLMQWFSCFIQKKIFLRGNMWWNFKKGKYLGWEKIERNYGYTYTIRIIWGGWGMDKYRRRHIKIQRFRWRALVVCGIIPLAHESDPLTNQPTASKSLSRSWTLPLIGLNFIIGVCLFYFPHRKNKNWSTLACCQRVVFSGLVSTPLYPPAIILL